MVNTITEPQVKFLKTLQQERRIDEVCAAALEVLRSDWSKGEATSKKASAVISLLLQEPKLPAAEEYTPGIYQDVDGVLYRTYLGQNSGKMLCKRVLFDFDGALSYEYVGAADKHLTGCRRLSREEVAAHTLTHNSGSCMICGRRLDDPESVDRGVGPVCWENYA